MISSQWISAIACIQTSLTHLTAKRVLCSILQKSVFSPANLQGVETLCCNYTMQTDFRKIASCQGPHTSITLVIFTFHTTIRKDKIDIMCENITAPTAYHLIWICRWCHFTSEISKMITDHFLCITRFTINSQAFINFWCEWMHIPYVHRIQGFGERQVSFDWSISTFRFKHEIYLKSTLI